MSRIIDIIDSIIKAQKYTKKALSRAEVILKSICNGATNLVDIADFKADNLLDGYDITYLKGKTISVRCDVDNSHITGTGGRIRLDITNAGSTSNSFGDSVVGGEIAESSIANIFLPSTATKIVLYFQSFSTSSDFSTFRNIMVNEGTTAKAYCEYIKQPQSRYEELLLAIKNNGTTSMTARSRLETILIKRINKQTDFPVSKTEIESKFIEWFKGV
jgi:hypothetical protein